MPSPFVCRIPRSFPLARRATVTILTIRPCRQRRTEASMDTQFDLLLRGGRVIDPASERDGIADIGIRGDRIAAIEPAIPADTASKVLDVSGKVVIAGMIDTHAHVYQYVTGRFGLNADMVGVRSGVTTLVDQGGPSCMTFRAFATSSSSRRKAVCCASSRLSGRRHGRPSLPGALWAGSGRCQGDDPRRAREPGHCARREGPCGDNEVCLCLLVVSTPLSPTTGNRVSSVARPERQPWIARVFRRCGTKAN